MQNFENYLCERNDTIDNAAYQLIGVLTAEDPGASLEDDPVPQTGIWRSSAKWLMRSRRSS